VTTRDIDEQAGAFEDDPDTLFCAEGEAYCRLTGLDYHLEIILGFCRRHHHRRRRKREKSKVKGP